MNHTDFPHRLREERERLGWTQSEFADLGGVKRTTQSFYEKGTRVPDLRYLQRIGEEGVDITYLVVGERCRKARKDLVAISPTILMTLYEMVDEFCVDREGLRMNIEVRTRFFQMLLATVKYFGEEVSLEAIRAEMSNFLSEQKGAFMSSD